MTHDEIIGSALSHAGIEATSAEVERLVALYPMVAEMVRSVHAVPTDDEAMALVFNPSPSFVD